VNQAHETEPCT